MSASPRPTTPLNEHPEDYVVETSRRSHVRRSSSPLEPYLRQLKWHPTYKMGDSQQDADKADIVELGTTVPPSTPSNNPPLQRHNIQPHPTVLGPPWNGPAPLLSASQPPVMRRRPVSNLMPDRFESAETFQPPTGRWVTERSEAMQESLSEYMALQEAAVQKKEGRRRGSIRISGGGRDVSYERVGLTESRDPEVAMARHIEQEAEPELPSEEQSDKDEAEDAPGGDEDEATDRCSSCKMVRPRSSFFVASATRPRNAGGVIGRYGTCFVCRGRRINKGRKELG